MPNSVCKEADAVEALKSMPTEALQMWRANQLNKQLLGSMSGTFATAAGLGMAGAGGAGLYNLIRRNSNQAQSPGASLMFSVPTSRPPHSEEKQGSMLDGVKNFLGGVGANSLNEHPLALAGEVTAAGTGLYGGYRLVDYLLDQRRKQDLKRELGDAEGQYEQSLQRLANPPEMKAAEADPQIDQQLDELFETTKEAGLMGEVANVGLAPWPMIALGTGLLSYSLANSRRKNKLLNKAIRRRQQDQLDHEPMYAFPDYRPARELKPLESLETPKEESQALEAA